MAVNTCWREVPVLQDLSTGPSHHPPAAYTEGSCSKASREARAVESLAHGQGRSSFKYLLTKYKQCLILLLAITKVIFKNALHWDFPAI